MNNFILKGDIAFSTSNRDLKTCKDAYLVCENGVCKGVFNVIPEQYKGFGIIDHSNKLIIPGFTDLHLHASQYQYRGTGMDVELMEWLDKYAFNEEGKFVDLEYAKKSYSMFVNEVKKGFTTRLSIFATSNKTSTIELMKQLNDSGLVSYVGLVEMDRLCSDAVRQISVSNALKDTEEYILESKDFRNTKPIITPRFLPSCSDELMLGISSLRKKYNLPSQSHLDENPKEISLVLELEKDIKNYSEGYQKFDMFGKDHNCIMAHCVYNSEEEIQMLKDNNIYVAHCPESNLNITSGIAPISKYLDKGINVGLGSDIAGGSSLSLLRAMRQAIQVSKMYYRYTDKNSRILDLKDAFYMATLGGGKFFGKVGTFLEGYEFDAVIVDDSLIPSLREFTLLEKLERVIYIGDENLIVDKYCKGVKII